MNACLAVFVHAAEMRHHDTTKLSIRHWLAGLVCDFNQHVTLANMIVPRGLGTANSEQTKL